MHGNIIKQTIATLQAVNKALDSNNQEYINNLRDFFADQWNPEANNEYFGHHAVKHGYIPTGYAALDSIVQKTGINVAYQKVENPYTLTTREEPDKTRIKLPHPSVFKSPDRYAAVLAHELGHATMPLVHRYLHNEYEEVMKAFGIPLFGRALEELTAELISYKLCNMVGIDSSKYSSLYLASQLSMFNPTEREAKLKEAENYANEAVDYLVKL